MGVKHWTTGRVWSTKFNRYVYTYNNTGTPVFQTGTIGVYYPSLFPDEPESPDCVTTYYNVETSGEFTKNDCEEGEFGTVVTYTVPAGSYVSTVSQSVVDALAEADVAANGQAYANEEGTCSSVPVCPDRVVVIQICNSNSIIDDNFDVYLNGLTPEYKIGAVDLNDDAQIGSVFIASLDSALEIVSADFVCPLVDMVVYRFDPALLQPSNTIYMVNTQNNAHGNQGDVGIRNYLLTGDELSAPCVIADLEYSGSSGVNFTLPFDYTACCPED